MMITTMMVGVWLLARVRQRRRRKGVLRTLLLVSCLLLAVLCLYLVYWRRETTFLTEVKKEEGEEDLQPKERKPKSTPMQNLLRKKVDSLRENLAARLRKEVAQGKMHLSDMDSIRRANSDVLPNKSYFKRQRQYVGPHAAADEKHLPQQQQQQAEPCSEEEEEKVKKSCVAKFGGRGLINAYAEAPKYKTIGCVLRKNMSTLLRAIFCFLRDEANLRDSGASLFLLDYVMQNNSQPSTALCENRERRTRDFHSVLVRGGFHAGGGHLLAMVREPVERFLSGFTDICVRKPKQKVFWKKKNPSHAEMVRCNGCGSNLTCFIIAEYHRLRKFELNTSQLSSSQLDKFVEAEEVGEDRHFFPQNWQCDFKSLLPRYTLIHYSPSASRPEGENGGMRAQSDFIDRLLNYLRNVGVGTKSLAYIRHHLEKDTTHHVTHDTEARRFLEQRLRDSPFLMEFLVRMFYWDFRLLGFPLPTLNWGRGGVNSGL